MNDSAILRAWLGCWCLSVLLVSLLPSCSPSPRSEVRVLVFSKTMGYRHASIPDGVACVQQIAQAKGWQVDTTEDATQFNEENLSRYSVVVFLSTTGDVLDHRQQADFERYIQAGGGFVGIHAASDTEYRWPWYGRLVGAYFESHTNDPNVLDATMQILQTDHPSTAFLAGQSTWRHRDEYYNFRDIYHGAADGIIPLLNLDEASYEGGTNGAFHPITWYHAYDGGRAWYTNLGHTSETFKDKSFIQLLTGGLQYAIGDNYPLAYQQAHRERTPDPRYFRIDTLTTNLVEPTELVILPDGKALWAQRGGELMCYAPKTKQVSQVGFLPVWTKFEDGMVGLALDPDFVQNHWLYIYYAPADTLPRFRLSRFEFRDDRLLVETELPILEVPVQRDTCCHTGGSIEFDADGLLYLSTGDDTNPFGTPYAPIDNRMGREAWDAQRSSGNPSDLRGKILRIRPLAAGGYEIPDGNLFPADGREGRPEIYVMGCRNPYRISIDQHTGFVYWGDVGPDGKVDSSRGPRGYDEVNQARKPGFFGWPYFVGNNYAYREVDFNTEVEYASFTPENPLNDSRHNQGTQTLPAAQPAMIWYPYDASPEFPSLGSGGRNAMAGPIYYADDFADVSHPLPSYYDGKLFIYDFMRDWVKLVSFAPNGDLETIEPFLPAEQLGLSSPMDMTFGPDGSLYVLTYGTRWFKGNEDAGLFRIYYSEANRPPHAVAQAVPQAGVHPLTVHLSASHSYDVDPDDEISYRWILPSNVQRQSETTSLQFDAPGVYPITLMVSDKQGAETETILEVQVGNAPPSVEIELMGNQDFFWPGRPIQYAVQVEDLEDGSLANEDINPSAVSVRSRWVSLDPSSSPLGHQTADQNPGQVLMQSQGCMACHDLQKSGIGPAYAQVAARYQTDPDALDYLTQRIRNGGRGVWGDMAMPAMKQVSEQQARQLATYILGLGAKETDLPPSGQLEMAASSYPGKQTALILEAHYADQGAPQAEPLAAEARVMLRQAHLEIEHVIDEAASQHVQLTQEKKKVKVNSQGYVVLQPFDWTEVRAMTLRYQVQAQAGLSLDLRLGDPEGPLLTQVTLPHTLGQAFATKRFPIPTQQGSQTVVLVPSQSSAETTWQLDWLELLP